MSFDPKEFVAVAAYLREAAGRGDCPAEAAYGAAIGRYYYAAMLCARDHFAETESTPVDTSESTHRWVRDRLREYRDAEALKLGRELDTMRISRNKADYGDELSDLPGECARMAGRCERALGYVKTLRVRATRGLRFR